MVQFYFHNSYTQSLSGYQLTQATLEMDGLQLVTNREIMAPEIRSALLNSGAVCLAGTTQNGFYYVQRGIQVTDSDERKWFINLAVEAAAEDQEIFKRLVHKLTAGHRDFLNTAARLFRVTEEELSYQIDMDVLRHFVEDEECPTLEEDSFYQTENKYIQLMKDFLKELNQGLTEKISLMAAESSAKYFFAQNPYFDGEPVMRILPAAGFKYLILADDRLFAVADVKEPETKTEQTGKFSEESLERITDGLIKGAKYAAIGAAVYGVYRSARSLFRKGK